MKDYDELARLSMKRLYESHLDGTIEAVKEVVCRGCKVPGFACPCDYVVEAVRKSQILTLDYHARLN